MVFNMHLYRVMRKTKSHTKFGHSSMNVDVSRPRDLREIFCSAKHGVIFSFTLHTIQGSAEGTSRNILLCQKLVQYLKIVFLCVLDPRI